MQPENLLAHIPRATKAIYAIGFERRHLPIAGLPSTYGYNQDTGEVAPGIYGVGMAFPEIMPHEQGDLEHRITSIWPFIRRLEILLPRWLEARALAT